DGDLYVVLAVAAAGDREQADPLAGDARDVGDGHRRRRGRGAAAPATGEAEHEEKAERRPPAESVTSHSAPPRSRREASGFAGPPRCPVGSPARSGWSGRPVSTPRPRCTRSCTPP